MSKFSTGYNVYKTLCTTISTKVSFVSLKNLLSNCFTIRLHKTANLINSLPMKTLIESLTKLLRNYSVL